MKIKKYTHLFLGMLLMGSLLAGCSSGQAVGKTERKIDYAAMSTLADALRVQSGLQVVGSQNSIKVTVRGVNSSRSTDGTTFTAGPTGPKQRETRVLTDVEPLFIVDNTIVGNTYDAASRAVNVQDIVSIKVLKSYSETNSYGESGKNGVILISTKLSGNQ